MKELVVRLHDDFDGSTEGVSTIEFSYGGVAYEIDLSEAHAAEMTQILRPYVDVARRAVRPYRKRKATASSNGDRDHKGDRPGKELRDKVRAYAAAQGLPQGPTGYLRRDAITAWVAVHPEDANKFPPRKASHAH